MPETRYDLAAVCDYCAGKLQGLGVLGDDGKARHLACDEAKDKVARELQVFEVEVMVRGSTTLRVVAYDEAEAEDLAEGMDIDPGHLDQEVAVCTVDESDAVSALDRKRYAESRVRRDRVLDARKKMRENRERERRAMLDLPKPVAA